MRGPLQSPEEGCTCFYTAAAVRSFRSGGGSRVCWIRPVPGFKRAGGSGISRSQGARDAGGFHEGFQKTAGGGLHGILYGGFRRGHDPSGRPLRGGGGPWGRPGIFILQADGVPGVRRRHRGPGRVFLQLCELFMVLAAAVCHLAISQTGGVL